MEIDMESLEELDVEPHMLDEPLPEKDSVEVTDDLDIDIKKQKR